MRGGSDVKRIHGKGLPQRLFYDIVQAPSSGASEEAKVIFFPTKSSIVLWLSNRVIQGC